MELTGAIISLEEKSGVSQRGTAWKKQDVVLEMVGGNHVSHAALSVTGEERIQRFCLLKGETVKVDIIIDAHEYQGRWYNEISIVKVNRAF